MLVILPVVNGAFGAGPRWQCLQHRRHTAGWVQHLPESAHEQISGQAGAVRAGVNKLGSEDQKSFYIEAGCRRRLLGVGLMQDIGLLGILGCRDEVGIRRCVA